MNCSSMRDDAVVRRPRVQMLSLTAIGTPASGASRQRPRSRSIAAARASARSAATALNAFSRGLSASMRASASRHTSDAERAPDRTPSRTSRTVIRNSRSRDYSRHAEEPGVERRVRRVGQRLVAIETRAYLVGPIRGMARDNAGRRRDAGCVDLLNLVRVREDVAQLAREQVELVFVELELREGRDLR